MKKEAMDHFYKFFSVGDIVSKNEIIRYLEKYYSMIKPATLEWRLSDLRSAGFLKNYGKDSFMITDHLIYKSFNIDIDKVLFDFLMEYNQTVSILKEKDPKETEVNISVWNTNILNRFTTHQIFRNYTIIEIDEYRVNSLSFELKVKYRNVIPSVKVKDLDYLIYNEKQVYVVEKLPKKSPLLNKKSRKNHYISTPKPEKILVDVLVYKKTILPYDDSEIRNIYRNMYKEYRIDKSTILNYARIRGSKIRNEVETMIMSLEEILDD
jgi:hypothetical protein